MTKRTKIVETCLQCEGDILLGVREDAADLRECMDLLSEEFNGRHIKGTKVSQFVAALLSAYHQRCRREKAVTELSRRVVSSTDELIACLRFIADASRHGSGKSVTVGGPAIQVDLSELMRVAIERIKGAQALLVMNSGEEVIDRVAELLEKP
jgi:hypothetical protein